MHCERFVNGGSTGASGKKRNVLPYHACLSSHWQGLRFPVVSAMILLCYGITHLPSGKFLVIEISTRLLSTRREKHDFAVLHAMSHTTGLTN